MAPSGPSHLILRPSRGKTLRFLAISLAFVAIGTIQVLREGGPVGYFCLGFFLLCTLVFSAQLMPTASYLELRPQGFVVCSLFRQSPLVAWSDVGEFRVARVPPSRTKMLVYDCPTEICSTLRRVNRILVGAEGGVPDVYGRTPEEMAGIMNEWRRRAGGGS